MKEPMKDTGMEQARNALSALREASAGLHAPEELEVRMRRAFQAHHAAGPLVRSARRYLWIGGAIAASLVVAAAIRLSNPAPVNPPEPHIAEVHRDPERPAEVQKKPKSPVAASRVQSTPAGRNPRRVPAPNAGPAPVTAAVDTGRPVRQVTTDFFAIPYAPAMTQFDRGQFVRVKVPASSMRSFGLPVSEERAFDRVQADVLMGEDGIARAIRFVR